MAMMSDEDPRLGATIAGYGVERVIGRGGMGVVYAAAHTTLRRPAALKIVAPELAADAAFRARFLREARTVAMLSHPNVVGVYDAGEVDGLLYLAMQLIDGPDLAAIIHAEGRLGAGRVAHVVGGVAAALDVAHEVGIVHRDVKPGNVLVDAERAYLGDFGLTTFGSATEAGFAATRVGEIVGTSHYLAPEVVEGHDVDGRADQYGLACVAVHALTGQAPFPRDNEMAVLYAHVHEPAPLLSQRRPGLPVALDAIVARALAKDPAARWPSCSAFAEALAAAAGPADDEPAAAASAVPVVPVAGDSPSKATMIRPAPRSSDGRPRMLLAGLDANARALVRVAVGSEWAVEEAGDTVSAVLKAQANPPDVVLVAMDSTSAAAGEVVRGLRAEQSARDAHVVLLARGRPGARELAAVGADDALALPFSPLQLRVKLRRLGGISG